MRIIQLLLTVILNVIFHLTFCQNKVDSIENLLYKTEINNTTKSRLLNELSWELKSMDSKKSFTLAEEAFSLATKGNDKANIVFSYRNFTAIYFLTNKWDKCLVYGEKGLTIARENNLEYEEAKILNLLGLCSKIKLDYNEALDYHKQALDIFINIKDTEEVAGVMNNISLIYTRMDDRFSALKILFDVVDLEEKRNNKLGKARTYSSIGDIYKTYNDPQKALEYYFESILLCQEIGNKVFEAATYNNIANVYLNQNEFKKAIQFSDKAAEINKDMDNDYWLAHNYLVQTIVYTEMKEFRKAIEKLEIVTKIRINLGDSSGLADCYYWYSVLSFSQNDPNLALDYGLKMLSIVEKLKIADKVESAYNNLYKIHKSLGQYQKSLSCFEKSTDIKDSLKEIKREELVLNLERKYQSQKKEQKNKLLKSDNIIKEQKIQKQKQIVFLFALLLLVSIVFTIYFIRSRSRLKKNNKVLILQKEEITTQKEELVKAYELLKKLENYKEAMVGMIVHDLKNPLNTLLHSAENNHPIELQTQAKNCGNQMLNLVSNLLDVQKYENSKMNLDIKENSTSGLIKEAVSQVISLVRQKNINLSFENNVPEIIQCDKNLIIRILVNLLTNAVKYTPLNGKILVKAFIKVDFVSISIIDSGAGIPESKLKQVFDMHSQLVSKPSGFASSTGIGLAFCKLAVESHGGRIEAKSTEGNGSEFCFTIPVKPISNSDIKNKTKYEILNDTSTDISIPVGIPDIEIQALLSMKIYEYSKISLHLEYLKSFTTNKDAQWFSLVFNAVRTGNESEFRKLLT